MLGSQPVEEHPIGDLPGQAAHLRTEGRHDEADGQLGPQLGDPRTDASEGTRVGASDPEEEAIQRERVGSHTLDDAVRAARVERNDADAEVDTLRLARRHGQRCQPVSRAGMVHPEGTVPEPLGLPRRRTDDRGRHACEQGEAVSHDRLLRRIPRKIPRRQRLRLTSPRNRPAPRSGRGSSRRVTGSPIPA